jgi:C1A family cysteine protease
LKKAVSEIGPAVLGVPWYEGMFKPASCGHLHPTGERSGGHAILCRGIYVKKKAFLVHNSWGEGWGDGGTALVHFEDMDFLLSHGGEACIPTKRVKTP